jgi:ATP-dependent Clp protease ATP-binding subunit ClpA
MFAPIDDLMSMFENAFTNTANPFSANTTQGEKSESTTPSLDYFGTDLTAMARTKKIDPII